jgi:uncharacterized protein (TIGR02421 family)
VITNSLLPGLANMTTSLCNNIIYKLSTRIVKAQTPIRILNEINWPETVKTAFFNHGGKQLPNVTANFYRDHLPLKFNAQQKIKEFTGIAQDIKQHLGKHHGVASIMQRMCYEYIKVVEMLQARGSKQFTDLAKALYGSTQDSLTAGAPALINLAKQSAKAIAKTMTSFAEQQQLPTDQQKFSSKATVAVLRQRLQRYFAPTKITITLSDSIIADASAGAECIKINAHKTFDKRDIRLLEIHEGWVHLGTTLNGLAQPICSFLSKGPPSATITQEGLAILTEFFTFSSYPKRIWNLTNRITAISMAEAGANFLEVFEFYCQQGLNDDSAYNATARVFRGSTPEGGPFTKDLSYCKGFSLICNYLAMAVQRGLLHHIPLLFLGKTTLEDLPILADLVAEGTVITPKYLPPPFRDIAALSAGMCYTAFFNQANQQQDCC